MEITHEDRIHRPTDRRTIFVVPRFQRPYCWERGEVEDFWNDTVTEPDSDYFIGSIVLFKRNDGTFGIVDGQQRMTTITMLLCALRKAFRAESLKDLADGLHCLVERPDINHKNQYVLQTETSYPYLQTYIQNPEKPDSQVPVGEEEARLKDAFAFLVDNIHETVEAVRRDKTISAARIPTAIKKKLVAIRDKVLRIKVIVITLLSEEDAYLIFETLNTRGKDLTISDLIRTGITRLLPQSNVKVDRPKERFSAIVGMFDKVEDENPISVNTFLHHYWLSTYEYTTEKKLYKAFKKQIRNKEEARQFLDSLESNAESYRIIFEPESVKWKIEEVAIRDALKALKLFKVRQQLPFVLSVLHEYRKGGLNVKQTRRALQAVERFHFIFTAVTSQRSSGGISFMYAAHARQLRSAATLQDKIAEIDALIAKLRGKRPPYQEFEAAFSGIACSETFPKRKQLVQYVFGRMNQQYLPGFTLDQTRMTIEHLANQSRSTASVLSDEEVARIGNLMLITGELNGKLRNKSYAEKLKILKAAPIWTDDFLLGQKVWGREQILQRGTFLAKKAYDDVWRF
jgi:uncharacterized protein with ParB-like and HNH nuclease domain